MSKIEIFFLNNSYNAKEKISMIKPPTYQELIKQLGDKFQNISKKYEIFYLDKKNNSIKINNEETYKIVEDILFIRELDKKSFKVSIFEKNYKKLSESKREKLEEKYNCILCCSFIKYENPYLCYNCQTIYHQKCLKDWDDKCRSQNKILSCPNCRNELPIGRWQKKLDYEETRKDNANLINKINEYRTENILRGNVNYIKNNKINFYKKHMEDIVEIFRKILNKINSINHKEEKLNNIYKNSINVKYFAKSKGNYNIFGREFVENNKENINLIINGKNNSLVDNYELKDGENIITIIIKNKLTNLSYMFSWCNSLTDIKELQYLNVEHSQDYSYMFCGCSSLNNLNPLENWNVSNGTNFTSMFCNCSNLLDIKPLQKWNVSNGIYFQYMFYGCSLLANLNPLKNWNVSKGENFENMFFGCSSKLDIQILSNWKLSKEKLKNLG